MRKFITTTISCLFCLNLFADFRIWEDREGNQYDAEFIREMFDKVTLRTREGKDVRMMIKEFCDNDQKYFRVMIPPNITVDVDPRSRVKEKPWEGNPESSFITTNHRLAVNIEKKSKRIFTSRLFVETFQIAKERDVNRHHFVLMDVSKSDFLLDESKGNKFVFKTKSFDAEQYIQKGTQGQYRGEEYVGYIVLVTDAQGNIIERKSSIAGKWSKEADLLPKLRDLWTRGRASKRSRHFDKNGDKVALPRVRHFTGGQD